MDCKYETHRACPVESLYTNKKRRATFAACKRKSLPSQREVWRDCKYSCGYPHKKIEQSKPTALFLMCQDVLDHRTFIEDSLKILDFIEWLNENHPDKASYHTSKM